PIREEVLDPHALVLGRGGRVRLGGGAAHDAYVVGARAGAAGLLPEPPPSPPPRPRRRDVGDPEHPEPGAPPRPTRPPPAPTGRPRRGPRGSTAPASSRSRADRRGCACRSGAHA